jgi:chemotaxis response regulator CheB
LKEYKEQTMNDNGNKLPPLFVVAIGASAGGHQPLFDFFSNLPHNTQAAFIVIMHLKRDYVSNLDVLIGRHTKLSIIKVKRKKKIQPNCIYILPENKYMHIHDGTLALKNRPSAEMQNLAIDIFFTSLAEDAKERSIGIIFSGMGNDGSKGMLAIERHGGSIIVQDPPSARYAMMPEAAISSNHPDYISTPANIALNLMKVIELHKLSR